MDFRSVLWKLRQDRMHTIQTAVRDQYILISVYFFLYLLTFSYFNHSVLYFCISLMRVFKLLSTKAPMLFDHTGITVKYKCIARREM